MELWGPQERGCRRRAVSNLSSRLLFATGTLPGRTELLSLRWIRLCVKAITWSGELSPLAKKSPWRVIGSRIWRNSSRDQHKGLRRGKRCLHRVSAKCSVITRNTEPVLRYSRRFEPSIPTGEERIWERSAINTRSDGHLIRLCTACHARTHRG